MHKLVILGFIVGVASSFVAQALFETDQGKEIVTKAKTLKASFGTLNSEVLTK